MRITLRLIVSLAMAVAAVGSFSAYFEVRQEKERQREQLESRSRLLSDSLEEAVLPLMDKGAPKRIQRLAEKFRSQDGLVGVAVYDLNRQALAVTTSLAPRLKSVPASVRKALDKQTDTSGFEMLGKKEIHVYARPIGDGGKLQGVLALFDDVAHIESRPRRIWSDTFLRALIQMILITLVTLVIVRWNIVGPLRQMVDWMKSLREGGESSPAPTWPKIDLFAPIAREMSTFARHLTTAKAAAEEEAKLRRQSESLWTAERLKGHVKLKLDGRPLFVVSNREPYLHFHNGRRVEWMVPAGGLVTALDPVLKATGGTWIAHGSGDADWDTVDDRQRLSVPPDDPQYTLRRVALTKEQEAGYYYGFSNEGLWPLCHIAHTRPNFRATDWVQYQQANQKFAEAVLEEMKGVEEPCLLIQDYHFALLPRLIKEARPDAKVGLFWHIPWPNPEAFGICPWQRELVEGMTGADLVGFHTQFHCNNFLDTVDRTVECRVDWERFSVTRQGHSTLVKPFPISVAYPEKMPGLHAPGRQDERADVFRKIGPKTKFLAIGVERMDYTKGVLERFWALERFFEKYPQFQGQVTYAQIGAPSRTNIPRYKEFLTEVDETASRINAKYKHRDWVPIVLLSKHHSHEEIQPFFRQADVCMVTSLHDGMNLVAKEFVAARSDEGGALILSRFTGASRELRDALIVNPYNVEQMADALRRALEMEPEESAARMRRMRETIRENNIYKWAGTLIEELTKIRTVPSPAART